MTSAQPARINIDLPMDAIAAFCRRWQIRALALFGSVLREDFGPESDVDVLVTFDPSARWSLIDAAIMQEELEALISRKVDLVSRRGIEHSANLIRCNTILNTAKTIFSMIG